MTVFLIMLPLIVIFIVFIIIRTLSFTPKLGYDINSDEITINKEVITKRICELVRCKTVSYKDSTLEDNAEFEKLISLLPTLYPNVFNACSFERLPDRALLFKWKGKNSGPASVMMAHYDVVPVNEDEWEKNAFDAVVENGIIWGRGTLDTKVTFNAVLSSADLLISQDFIPENDIYFAFSGGEEVNGNGAKNIVDHFIDNGIEIGFVVDEGGAVVENVFPGVKAPCGMIGIAEKGLMNLEFTAKSQGGHASSPKPGSPVPSLSKACIALEDKPFKFHITPPVKKMFDTLGRHSTFVYRMIFANLWLFKPILNMICKKTGGELNALVRTTMAFTKFSGSNAENVIPPKASMVSNIRLNPYDNMESALSYIKKTVNNDKIDIKLINGMEPSRISETNCPEWEKIASAVASTWQGCIVSPYLMVQCSDSRHYGRISDKVYRFSAMDLTSEERASIHGNNERIRIDCACRAVEFYIRLMKKI